MRPLDWELLHPAMTRAHLGFLPTFVDADNPEPVAKQINQNYPFGGWQPMGGWIRMEKDGSVRYPGDPKMKPLAKAMHGSEEVFFYESSWVAVRQPDGKFEIARLD